MKKLLLILLCLPLLFTTCKKEDEEPTTPTMQSVIVGKKWEGNTPNNGNTIFELNNNGNLNLYDIDICGLHLASYLGDWIIKGDTIKYTYISNNFEYTQIFGIISEYSSSELKLFINTTTNSICSIYTSQPTENCTYIPDNEFENYLESNGMGDGIAFNDIVLTSAINTVISLNLQSKTINDLRGIEDFTSLIYLDCSFNSLYSLDVSQNTNLDTLICVDNQIYSLDVSNNTALTYLNCGYNQLTSLDVSQNTALTILRCYHNQLTSLDVSNGNNTNFPNWANNAFHAMWNPNLTCINVDNAAWSTFNWNAIDPQHYFSEQCP